MSFFKFLLMSFLMVLSITAKANETISTGTTVSLMFEKQAVTNWIVNRTKNRITYSSAQSIVEDVYTNALKLGLDPLIIIGMISKESMFRHNVKSSYGAKGLLQVVPRYHMDKIGKRNIYNQSVNIEVGVNVLFDCIKRRKDITKALNCYSGGAKNYSTYVNKRHAELKSSIALELFANDQNIHNRYSFNKPINELFNQPTIAGLQWNQIYQREQ
jgi:soluble lytic murein transglycosylase-like protein